MSINTSRRMCTHMSHTRRHETSVNVSMHVSMHMCTQACARTQMLLQSPTSPGHPSSLGRCGTAAILPVQAKDTNVTVEPHEFRTIQYGFFASVLLYLCMDRCADICV